jgi:hypothetical protein
VQSVNVLRQLVKVVIDNGDEKELRECKVDDLSFRPKRRKDVKLTAEEMKELAALEDEGAEGEKPQRHEKSDRQDKGDKKDRFDRSRKNEKHERFEKPDKSDKNEKVENVETQEAVAEEVSQENGEERRNHKKRHFGRGKRHFGKNKRKNNPSEES